MHATLLLALVVAAGCSPAPPTRNDAAAEPPPAGASAVLPIPEASAAPAAPSTTSAPALKAKLPPLADVRTLLLRLQQGGPSIPRCANSVQYEIELDVATSTLVSRSCHPEAGDEPGQGNMKTRTKKLIVEQREIIDRAYAKLERAPGGNCANDGAPITLELTKGDGSKESLLAQSCGKPPPDIARGLADFLSTTASIAFSR